MLTAKEGTKVTDPVLHQILENALGWQAFQKESSQHANEALWSTLDIPSLNRVMNFSDDITFDHMKSAQPQTLLTQRPEARQVYLLDANLENTQEQRGMIDQQR